MSAALGLLPVLQFGSLYALHVVRAARRDPKPARQLPLPPATPTPTPPLRPYPLLPPQHTHTRVHPAQVREAQLYGAAPLALHMTHVKGAGIDFTRNNLRTMGACLDPLWCMGTPNVTAAALKVRTLYLLWLYLLCLSQRSSFHMLSTRHPSSIHPFIHSSTHPPTPSTHPSAGLHAAPPRAVGSA